VTTDSTGAAAGRLMASGRGATARVLRTDRGRSWITGTAEIAPGVAGRRYI